MVLTPQNVANSPITSYPVAKFTAVVDGKTVEIQGVALVDSTGAEYNTGNPLPTTGGGGGGGDVNLFDGEGNAITSHLATDKRGIDVTLIDSVGGYPLTSHGVGLQIALDTVILDSTGTPFSAANPFPTTVSGTVTVVNDPNIYSNPGGDTFITTGDGTAWVIGQPMKYWTLLVYQTGTVTSWTVDLQVSIDGNAGHWTTILTHTKVANGDGQLVSSSPFLATSFKVVCSALTLGVGTNIKAYMIGSS